MSEQTAVTVEALEILSLDKPEVKEVSKNEAIKLFVEDHPKAAPVESSEILAFYKACSKEEWSQFARDAAKQMDLTLKGSHVIN